MSCFDFLAVVTCSTFSSFEFMFQSAFIYFMQWLYLEDEELRIQPVKANILNLYHFNSTLAHGKTNTRNSRILSAEESFWEKHPGQPECALPPGRTANRS